MLRRFKITKLPQFLIFHVKRFNKNNFTLEKNPTIVNYPISNLDMRECKWRRPSLQYLLSHPLLIHILDVDNPDQAGETRYDLVANICHQGLVDSGVYKAHLKSKSNGQWYEIQDLFVEEIKHELICLSETYIQVWSLSKRALEGMRKSISKQ